jgi:hypothetical protein
MFMRNIQPPWMNKRILMLYGNSLYLEGLKKTTKSYLLDQVQKWGPPGIMQEW